MGTLLGVLWKFQKVQIVFHQTNTGPHIGKLMKRLNFDAATEKPGSGVSPPHHPPLPPGWRAWNEPAMVLAPEP